VPGLELKHALGADRVLVNAELAPVGPALGTSSAPAAALTAARVPRPARG
jgi:hypothetical protein